MGHLLVICSTAKIQGIAKSSIVPPPGIDEVRQLEISSNLPFDTDLTLHLSPAYIPLLKKIGF